VLDSAKTAHAQAKEPYITAKEHCFSAKEPYMIAKEPCVTY